MILDEITRYYDFEPGMDDTATEIYGKEDMDPVGRDAAFTKKLRAMGWTTLGNGQYSTVYGNPKKDYVLKVNATVDRAFAWYALLTRKFPNPHFPRIGNMKVYKNGRRKFRIYLMEKLESIPINRFNMSLGVDMNQVALHPYRDFDPTYKRIYQANPLLKEALKIIGKYSGDHILDIHTANIMRRPSDNQIVITDPYIG